MYGMKFIYLSGYIPPSSFNALIKFCCPSIINDGINKYPIPKAVTSNNNPITIKVFFPNNFKYFLVFLSFKSSKSTYIQIEANTHEIEM